MQPAGYRRTSEYGVGLRGNHDRMSFTGKDVVGDRSARYTPDVHSRIG